MTKEKYNSIADKKKLSKT